MAWFLTQMLATTKPGLLYLAKVVLRRDARVIKFLHSSQYIIKKQINIKIHVKLKPFFNFTLR
jgi:hypothetical protein